MEAMMSNGNAVPSLGLTVRRLKTGDIFRVAKLFLKMWKGGSVLDSKDFAETLLSSLLENEDEITAFLADLVGLTPEEFRELPPDAIFDIADALSKSEDIKRFLDKVKAVLAKMPKPPQMNMPFIPTPMAQTTEQTQPQTSSPA